MAINNFKFLVVGAGRGGTSLLSGLLDYHSQLEVAYEVYAEAFLVGKEVPYHGPELFDMRVNSFIEACHNTVRKKPDSMWGNKITTEQVFGLEDHNLFNPDAEIDVLDEFFNNRLKDIKVIFILRDGRTCINSKVKRTLVGAPIEKAAERWQYSVTCFKFFQTRHTNNHCIKFEDLLLRPQEVLTGICDFLNIPFEEKMLQGTDNQKILPDYRKTYFDQSKIAAVDLPEPIMTQIKDDLRYCGYL